MINERIEVHLECDTQEEVEACRSKLIDYGFTVEKKIDPLCLLAVKILILTKEEI